MLLRLNLAARAIAAVPKSHFIVSLRCHTWVVSPDEEATFRAHALCEPNLGDEPFQKDYQIRLDSQTDTDMIQVLGWKTCLRRSFAVTDRSAVGTRSGSFSSSRAKENLPKMRSHQSTAGRRFYQHMISCWWFSSSVQDLANGKHLVAFVSARTLKSSSRLS